MDRGLGFGLQGLRGICGGGLETYTRRRDHASEIKLDPEGNLFIELMRLM